jgi:Tfp pilus assembly protein PilX
MNTLILHSRSPQKPSKHAHARGFALISTISIMALLMMIAMAMMSLSTIEQRSSQNTRGMVEAQANARMALMLAIGELQKSMGPDQRVSANAEILSDPDSSTSTVKQPHWTGVWNSWQAGSVGVASTPDTRSEHSTIEGASNTGMQPTYTENRKDHFHSWLVSLNPGEASLISSPQDLDLNPDPSPDRNSRAVLLVGKGSLGSNSDAADYVSARLLALPTGRYGWWIGDESQKARIMDDTYQLSAPATSLAEKIFRHQAPGSTGTTTIQGFESLTDEQQEQLDGLASRQTLDLVEGGTGVPAENFHHITPFSYSVLADVREGGLKRDLTTLLERPLKRDDMYNGFTDNFTADANDFILYKFSTKDGWANPGQHEEMVPIHDLAAYYQLYDGNRVTKESIFDLKPRGTVYSSNQVGNGFQIVSPNYGTSKNDPAAFLRNYASLYSNPVPIRVQFQLSYSAKPIDPKPTGAGADTHSLELGITPSITFWNPTNLPLVLNFDSNPDLYAYMTRVMATPLTVKCIKNKGTGNTVEGRRLDLRGIARAGTGIGGGKAEIFSMYISGKKPVVFEPGETKVFSFPFAAKDNYGKTDQFVERHEAQPGWDASVFLANNNISNTVNLNFKSTDKISVDVKTDGNPFNGAAFQIFMIQASRQTREASSAWDYRHYTIKSRFGNASNAEQKAFNRELMAKGFPGQAEFFTTAGRDGGQIIAASEDAGGKQGMAFLYVSLMAGSESHEDNNIGKFAGRKFPSRPFLHSTAITPQFIDGKTKASFYHHGWNWWVDEVNSAFDAPVQISQDNQGYYGGGYGDGSGSTHVVQQEIPVVPPMSIAALSHAHLGGFSLAYKSPSPGYSGVVAPDNDANQSYQLLSATGTGGLFPHVLQAIGNSYAHPYIPAEKAYKTTSRRYTLTGGDKSIVIADHSYLANKAIWDDFFFSSISPAPSTAKVFGNSTSTTAKERAEGVFFGTDQPLPNRRMQAYTKNLSENKLDLLFTESETFTGGLADKIAAHLMVKGGFNVNTTSVEAWKVFFSSLKGKEVSYLDKSGAVSGGVNLAKAKPVGTPVSAFTLPNGKPVIGSSSDPSDPEQWFGWRDLSDTEIEELAIAMVKQVKLRGPFLSLSEFVNRRLQKSNEELSVKGALQAALDDDDVSINKGFRNNQRSFSGEDITGMNADFPLALEGPIAYGSAAYIDQADVLRNFAAQLTPRGDTFVVRSYGDSLDSNGDVVARAWCEAVVQRIPEYIDSTDLEHVKQADLISLSNKMFGRKLSIVSFRWLNPEEV